MDRIRIENSKYKIIIIAYLRIFVEHRELLKKEKYENNVKWWIKF